MLEIKDLHASVEGSEILKGISLSIKKGEIHAVMGPMDPGKVRWLKFFLVILPMRPLEEMFYSRGKTFWIWKRKSGLWPEFLWVFSIR